METQDPSPPAVPAACIDAVVQTGATETHYRRAGSGPPLLLLQPAGPEDDGGRLLARLAGSFRVIAPSLPPHVAGRGEDGAAFAAWLRDVIDGLGLAAPLLAADGALERDARRFRASDPERVGGVLALRDDGEDAARKRGT